jgi:acyl-CoA thioester hydrolase
MRREPLVGFRIRIPVRFSECDLYGVVWHGRYAIYLEEIRNAVTAKYGWTVARARDRGYLVPVTRMEIRYHAPARLDAVVDVVARLRKPETAKFVLNYEIRANDGSLLTSAETEQVVTRADGELMLAFPPFLRELAAEILRGQDDPAEQGILYGKMQSTGSGAG